jgi:hypothetical protein
MTPRAIRFGLILTMTVATHLACAQQAIQPGEAPVAPIIPPPAGGAFGGGSGGRTFGWQTVDGAAPGGSRSVFVRSMPGTGKMEKGTYLGISVTPVTGPLRAQLNLPPGVGLVVERVDKDSPAAAAGIQRYDILEQLNDQILVNPEQFGVVVRLAKPGDEASLKVFRKGESKTVTAKLIERDVPVMDTDNSSIALFRTLADPDFTYSADKTNASIKRALDLINRNRDGESELAYSDSELKLTVHQSGGDRHLLAKDAKTGKTLYDGPINKPEEREKLPANVLEKLKTMESNDAKDPKETKKDSK